MLTCCFQAKTNKAAPAPLICKRKQHETFVFNTAACATNVFQFACVFARAPVHAHAPFSPLTPSPPPGITLPTTLTPCAIGAVSASCGRLHSTLSLRWSCWPRACGGEQQVWGGGGMGMRDDVDTAQFHPESQRAPTSHPPPPPRCSRPRELQPRRFPVAHEGTVRCPRWREPITLNTALRIQNL